MHQAAKKDWKECKKKTSAKNAKKVRTTSSLVESQTGGLLKEAIPPLGGSIQPNPNSCPAPQTGWTPTLIFWMSYHAKKAFTTLSSHSECKIPRTPMPGSQSTEWRMSQDQGPEKGTLDP